MKWAEKAREKENSHTPVLVIQKQKDQQTLEKENRYFHDVLQQWDSHPDISWRVKAIQYAKKYPGLEYAKLLIAKENCDSISQERDSISQPIGKVLP